MRWLTGALAAAVGFTLAVVGPVGEPVRTVPAQAVDPASGSESAEPDSELRQAVLAALPEPVDPSVTRVTVRRTDPAGWAFGTAVRSAPPEPESYPDGWLWLARRQASQWQVAVEGDPGYAALATAAPLLTVPERLSLAGPRQEQKAGADRRTGMRLPYARGQAWMLTGGPHPMNGSARSSIDLSGGDGRVLAARDGIAYTMCESGTGWVRVVHDDGFATDYYHLEENIKVDGTPVREGDYLGRIGWDVSCGGQVTGPHLHFSLRRDGKYVPIEGYVFGRWTIHAGDGPYQGFARRGSIQVPVGGALVNHGALAPNEAVVDTDGGGVLHRRSGPGTDHAVIGTVADGEAVKIRCAARGTTHTGRDGHRTNVWYRLADSGWVSGAFLWTGTADPVGGWCPSES
jgi:LasA protease